ncbi:MAG: hypothetical protein RL538_648 [Candidatus Parcubacteria bacterium]|jgi:hypothetical protein
MSTNFLAQYQEFCASPLRTKEDVAAEFEELRRNANITQFVFHKPHILAIKTKPLFISWEGVDYEIGEFVIFFIRKREGRVWETGFRISNVTGAILDENQDEKEMGCYVHPHVILSDYEDISFPVGELCISEGQYVIYQSLRKGFVNKAFSHLWRALQTYGTGQPFLPLENWPHASRENNHD